MAKKKPGLTGLRSKTSFNFGANAKPKASGGKRKTKVGRILRAGGGS